MVEQDKTDKIIYVGATVQLGQSLCIIVPAPMARYLELEKGSKVQLISDVSKFGRYTAFWNPEQQKKRAKNKNKILGGQNDQK